ncbi:MAG: osteoblast specific factor 2-related protein [Gaiellaceae bacterium]|nr:MAG: osteoblast specific factor 2-related protein [Gaiellaceae bacterium]
MKKLVALVAVLATTALGAIALAAPATGQGRPTAPSPNLVDTAIAANAAGDFDVLLCLVTKYPDLVATLSQRGQLTVFAPTDAAFARIGLTEANCAEFQAANAETVKNILAYHVTVGRRDAASVVGSTRIRMLNGQFAEVTSSGGSAFIDGAEILVTDVKATNGIIHVVGGVLLP